MGMSKAIKELNGWQRHHIIPTVVLSWDKHSNYCIRLGPVYQLLYWVGMIVPTVVWGC